jgi:hypothetical protein
MVNSREVEPGSLRHNQVMQVATNDVHDTTPTIANLTASFGAPTTHRDGFVGIVDDNGAGAISYVVWVSGGFYFWAIGTKATT